jgi:hypothetical protein
MGFNLIVQSLAAVEIIEAHDWYEMRKDGLGVEFLNELEDFYKKIISNPTFCSYYEKPVRHGSLKRFPYTVVYEVVNESIVVYSVFMERRNPLKKRTE